MTFEEQEKQRVDAFNRKETEKKSGKAKSHQGNGKNKPEQKEETVSDTGAIFDDENIRTDMGNAARYLKRYGDATRYVYARKKFFCFDGKLWSDDQAIAERRASHIVKILRNVIGPDEKEAFKHYLTSSKPERRNAMLTFARSEISMRFEEFDADPELFNVQNGTIHLPTGELRPHAPGDYCTKIGGVKFDKDAEWTLWLQFLSDIFSNDWELIDYIQKAVGYSLSGLTTEQVFFLLYGIGKNGKSKFLTVLSWLLGSYWIHAQMETFTAHNRAGNGHSEDLASLRGARLVTAVESEESKRVSEGLIKQITGCDPVTASYKHEHSFTFKPILKLWLAANHKPIIRGTDDGIWRRVNMIPFLVQFEKDPNKVTNGKKAAVKDIEYQLLPELPGILNWAIEGYRLWKKYGLNPPSTVTAATEKYRQDSDLIGNFITERLIAQRREKIGTKASEIYQDYKAWCERGGEFPVNQTKFGTSMVERGYTKENRGGKVIYDDLFLLQETEEADLFNREV